LPAVSKWPDFDDRHGKDCIFLQSTLSVRLNMSETNNGLSSKPNGSPQDIDWPGLRAAVVAIGIRPAARQAAQDLPPDERERFIQRAMKRCSRQKWLVKAQQDKAGAILTSPSSLSANVRSGADVLTSALQDRKEKSALHLSKYVTDASKNLARSRGRLALSKAAADVVRVRAGVWPETTQAGALDLSVELDDSGKVQAMHARLAMLLGLSE
jgi:hypothetical protein